MLVDGKYRNRKWKTTLYCSYVETVLQNYIHHILNTSELNCSPTLEWFQFHLFYVVFDLYIAVKGNNSILLPKPHMIYAVQSHQLRSRQILILSFKTRRWRPQTLDKFIVSCLYVVLQNTYIKILPSLSYAQ